MAQRAREKERLEEMLANKDFYLSIVLSLWVG